ncbi:MAG: DUF302 domain-containing protein [Chloroflexi bacterium]|nr:DUF302 domain-containing protein [Chloroflexota bacterium]
MIESAGTRQLDYSVVSTRAVDEAERAVRDAAVGNGFRVLHVHDVQATFAEKGIDREPYRIVEVCNVGYAKQALASDPLIGLMMPCRINVFSVQGETRVSLLRPSLLADLYPDANLEALGSEIESRLRNVVDAAR